MFGIEIDPKLFWMGLGIILVFIEISVVPGIGFLFAGLGAITVFLLTEFNVIEVDWLANFAVFLVSSALWGTFLWKFLKKSVKNIKHPYSDMVGEHCKVISNDLQKDVIGQVSWSGTITKAAIDDSAGLSIIKAGSVVEVVSVKGNILYVKPVK